jgi:ribosomal protein L11 methyltransferase
MDYIELSVEVTPKEQGSDVLIASLSELDFESFVENDKGFSAYIQAPSFDEEAVSSVFSRFREQFDIVSSHRSIAQQNWNKEWESSFQPIEVDGRCYIRAPFHDPKEGFEFDIVIEPKMSFGTGHHQTTQLMISRLMLMNVKNRSWLDMGCGTGVLAIVAAQMGANPITAIDIDDWSFENTRENLERNNINNVLVHKGNAQILAGQLFHVILANINRNVLLADMPIYYRSLEKGGSLVLSGFFETDIPEISRKAEELGMKLEDRAVRDQWTMLHFIKPL